MATLLDAPKGPNPAKLEEFVEKQLTAARRRVRVLDFFMTGLVLGIGTLVFLLVVQIIDRYVETPRGAGWGVAGVYLALATAFVYLVLFRPARRQINPYYAAHHVEQAVPNAKNSLVTWVDFEEDGRLPGSIKTAISQKAYRDIKGVDLNRAIENRKVLWLGIAAGVLLLANALVAFRPPTRTELTLQAPKDGDITVFSNQEVAFQVRVAGRIPSPSESDHVRLRMWYNPDDPDSHEDRPMKAGEGDRREFNLTVPAKQVRTGFRYKVLAGNAQTPEYTVTAKILPEFRDFEVSYEYPVYLKQPAEKTNDANLLAPYGTKVTLTVATTREVKQGYVQFEGQDKTLDGQLVEGRPDAIRFTFPIHKEGTYQVFFSTPEGDKNTDPTKFRITVIDPKPVIRSFDLDYDYPAYLRFKPMKVVDVREPEVEAPKGTTLGLTVKTNRPVKAGTLELPGQAPIVGELLPDQPMWVRFRLPALRNEGTALVTFTPDTTEPAATPKTVPIRLRVDRAPEVQITDPQAQRVELPPTGTLDLKGVALDDHGVDKLTLRMTLKGSEDRELVSKPYRGGMSFLRKEDNSWPTKVEYKDFVKLPDLRMPKDPTWRAGPGMTIEYWLEADDNCTEPSPNRSVSQPRKTLVILAPPKPEEQKKIDQQNKQLENEQQRHEKQQDDKNKTENRDVKQEPPKGADPQAAHKDGPGEPKKAEPGAGEPKKGPAEQGGMNPPDTGEPKGGTPPDTAPDHEAKTKQVENALNKEREAGNPGATKPDTRPKDDAKVEPGEGREPPKDGAGGMPPTEDRTPKTDPNQDMGGTGPAGEPRKGEVDKTPQDKGTVKPDAKPMGGPGDEKSEPKPAGGGTGGGDAGPKPDTKPTEPKTPPGVEPKEPEKGTTRPETRRDPKEPGATPTKPGATKPDTEPKPGDEKRGSGEPGPMGDKPPADAGDTKPKEREAPGGAGRPAPKKDGMGGESGSRPGPKDESPAGGSRTPPKQGMNDEDAGEPKPGPGTPPPGDKPQKGELDREARGQLDREMNSTKPEIDPETKSTVDRLMRNPETRQQMRDKLDELERNAKDPLTRQKAQDLRNSGEQAAKDYDAEKPNKENVDQLAKKLNSKNEKERQEAEQRVKDWEKDPKTREDLKKETDELKKKDRTAGQKVDDAMQKAEQARNGGGKPDQKMDEKKLADMARDLNSKDQQTRDKATEQMKNMAGGDPKAGQQMQDKLNQMAKDAKTPEEKKNLEDAARQAGQMARKDGPKEPAPKVDEKALKDAADKLASNDEKTRQEGKEQLEKMMKDPKTRDQAKDMLDKMAKDARTDEEKKKFENAAQQAGEMARKEPGPKPTEKLDPKDLEKLTRDMAGKDEKARADAERKMQDLMKDPKTREQAMEQMKEMAKNASSEDMKKALQEAMKKGTEAAKNDPLDPKDLKDLAKKFEGMDEKSKQEMAKKFEEAMKDPELQKEMKKQAEEMANKGTPDQKKQFDDMMKQLGGNFPDLGGKPDPADPKNKLKAAELLLEDFKKKMTKGGFKELDWTKEQADRWMKDQQATIDALRRQVMKGGWRDPTTAKSAVKGGPAKVDFEGKTGGDLSGGSRYAPPAGYADPYKQFSIDAAKAGSGKK